MYQWAVEVSEIFLISVGALRTERLLETYWILEDDKEDKSLEQDNLTLLVTY